MTSLHPPYIGDEVTTKYTGTLTFLNGRIYKGELSPIDGKLNGILEIEDGSFYPVKFFFVNGSCIDFDEIIDRNLANTLLYGYNPTFGINSNIPPFNKEKISEIFNFDLYKKKIIDKDTDFRITIQQRIGNYNGDNIGYMPEGKGKLTYKNGDIYKGEFKQGIPNGKGKLILNKYGNMEGEFKNGLVNGEGKSSYPNRGNYEGEFKDGKPDGKGKVIYSN